MMCPIHYLLVVILAKICFQDGGDTGGHVDVRFRLITVVCLIGFVGS